MANIGVPVNPVGGCRTIQHIRSHCGSEPAREEVSTLNMGVECQIAFASRLAPTGDL